MLLKLKEADKNKLEALYLRLELIQREIGKLAGQREEVSSELTSVLQEIIGEQELSVDLGAVRPIFQNFQLQGLEIPNRAEESGSSENA